jgi:hypothetical protein
VGKSSRFHVIRSFNPISMIQLLESIFKLDNTWKSLEVGDLFAPEHKLFFTLYEATKKKKWWKLFDARPRFVETLIIQLCKIPKSSRPLYDLSVAFVNCLNQLYNDYRNILKRHAREQLSKVKLAEIFARMAILGMLHKPIIFSELEFDLAPRYVSNRLEPVKNLVNQLILILLLMKRIM